MTYRDSEREAIVDELLLDANLTGTHDVQRTLLSLGSLAHASAPAPMGELAAMLAGPHDELSKRRWRNKHRTAVISVAVVAAMGLGASGVAAASSGFTRTPTFIDHLFSNLAPQWSAAPAVLPVPDAPQVGTEPAQASDPAAIPPVSPTGGAEDADAPGPESPVQGQQVPGTNSVLPAPAAPRADDAQADRNALTRNTSPQGNAGNWGAPGTASGDETEPTEQQPGNSQSNAQGKAQSDKSQGSTPQNSKAQANKAQPTLPAVAGPGIAPAKPAPSAPGSPDKSQGNKNGHFFPALTGDRAGGQVPSFVDKLQQWLKRAQP
ncbi:hypothetical protein AB0N65_00985 [Paenarthrobacter sp. NPDC089322]|uniref:hypothetical protein n=1 Tax=Paenarthrobacter sp. NPDC089322 TaxID=3155065 RepID=UPI003442EFC8